MKEASDSMCVNRNRNIVNDQSNANYSEENEITYSTDVSKSNFCNYNNAYILARGNISIIGQNLKTEVAFKNCATFLKYIPKIDGETINNAEDLDLVMPIYSQTRQVVYGFILKMKQIILIIVLRGNDAFKFFKHKAKLLENTVADGTNGVLKNPATAVSLKYLK